MSPTIDRASRFVATALVLPLLATLIQCSSEQSDSALGGPPQPREAEVEIPSQVLGLAVVEEDISSEISNVQSATYVSSVAVFTMREGELLQASLQVATFNDLARPDSATFRRQVIALMGSGSPEELKIGETTVFMSSGTQQIRYTWFRGTGFYVLTVRREYPFRRDLLRKMLALEEPT